MFLFFLCLVSVDNNNHYMKAITPVLSHVFRMNHALRKTLREFYSGPPVHTMFPSRFLEARLLANCFFFLLEVSVYGTLPLSLNYVVTFSTPVRHFVRCAFVTYL